MRPEWWFVAVPALFAAALMPFAIRARSIGQDRADGIQAMHVEPTSRLGGTILFIAFALGVLVADRLGYDDLASALPLVLAAIPVVAVGLAEDLTRRVRPRYRLAGALVSAILASHYAGSVVPRVDLPLIDFLLASAWIALPVTWFMVVGACNAINLIDGVHGLASGTALIMFAGLALAAGWAHDPETLAQALAMMGAIAAFLLWNYPGGRIFLGDAGAYFIGFIYAALSIQLVDRNDGISAWYVVMLAGYPIVDTLFAMYRRGVVRRVPLMTPDALHLHSLVFRRLVQQKENRGDRLKDRRRANSRVAPRLWLHSLGCLAVAVVFYDNTPVLLVGLAAYAVVYMTRYRTLVRFAKRQVRQAAAGPTDERDR